MTCERCGQVHDRCKAHTRAGNPCRQPPMAGQRVCRMHGGLSPRGLAAGARRLARAEAARSLAEVEVAPIGDPLDALAQVAAEAVALKDHFANLVAELNKTMSFETWGGDQKLDARVALYERALDRAHRFLADWVRLGFEDRKVQLDEIRTARVVAFVRGVLADHGIDTAADETRQILRTWQPVLDGDAPPR